MPRTNAKSKEHSPQRTKHTLNLVALVHHRNKIKIENLFVAAGAKLKAQAEEITHTAELNTQQMVRACDLAYTKSLNDAEVDRVKRFAEIEV